MDLRDSSFFVVLVEYLGKIYVVVLEKEVQYFGICFWDSYVVQWGKEKRERKLGRWYVYKVLNWFFQLEVNCFNIFFSFI